MEGEAHENKRSKNAEFDLHALHERKVTVLESGRVLVVEERIEAKVAHVKLLETLSGVAVDAEREGGGANDGGRQSKHERVDTLDAAGGEKDGIHADVQDEAEANGADETARSDSLKEKAKEEATKSTGEQTSTAPKHDRDDTSDSTGNDCSDEEEASDGFGWWIDRGLDTNFEDDRDADEGQGKESS